MTETPYAQLIEALREAPRNFDPNDSSQVSYSVFGPGGVSWGELADIIEELSDVAQSLSDQQHLEDEEAEDAEETEPEYEYGYSHRENMAHKLGSAAGDNDRPQKWWDSVEEAEAARQNDLRWREPTFLIARTKAGDAFALEPQES